MKTLLLLAVHLNLVLGQSCPQKGKRYFPDREQCDKYYECVNAVKYERLCPDGLLFNDKITDNRYPCYYPHEVDCGSRSRKQPPQSTERCPHQWGYFASGNRSQCDFFLSCANGVAIEQYCPHGLAFSSATNRCEWPEASPDCDAAAFLKFSCPPSTGNGELTGYTQHRSQNDCRKFIICVNGNPRPHYCELGLVYKEATRKCVNPDEVEGCENHYSPSDLLKYQKRLKWISIVNERREAELRELRKQVVKQRSQP